MSQALVPYKVQPPAALLPTEQEIGMIQAIAKTAETGKTLLPRIGSGQNARQMTAGEASVIMLYGRELGVQPMASLSQIFVVNNRPTPSAQLLLGLMQSRDPNAGAEIVERTAERAKVRLTYRGRAQIFEATLDDAKRAGVTKNPTWASYPKQMLVWTAIRTGVRLMAPDALNALASLPSVEQAAAMVEATGEYIEGEATDVTDIAEEAPALSEAEEADIGEQPPAREEAPTDAPSQPTDVTQMDAGPDAKFLSSQGELDATELKGYVVSKGVTWQEIGAAIELEDGKKVTGRALLTWREAEEGRTIVGLLDQIVASREPPPAASNEGAEQAALAE